MVASRPITLCLLKIAALTQFRILIQEIADMLLVFDAVQEGKPETAKKRFEVNPRISWKSLLATIACELKLEEIEGLYDGNMLPICRTKSIKPNSLITVRMTEESCLLRSLVVDARSDEQYEVASHWPIVQEARKARIRLDKISNKAAESLKKSDLETEDIVPSMRVPDLRSIELMQASGDNPIPLLRDQAEAWDIQTMGLRELCERTKHHDETIYEIIESDFPLHIIKTLDTFREDEDITYYCAWLVANIIGPIIRSNSDVEIELLKALARCVSHTQAERVVIEHVQVVAPGVQDQLAVAHGRVRAVVLEWAGVHVLE